MTPGAPFGTVKSHLDRYGHDWMAWVEAFSYDIPGVGQEFTDADLDLVEKEWHLRSKTWNAMLADVLDLCPLDRAKRIAIEIRQTVGDME